MKKIALACAFLLASMSIYAQDTSAEATVRALDIQNLQATLTKDTITLLKNWSPDFTVNNPMGKIEKGGRNTLDRPVITQLEYASFKRNVEHVMVKGDVVILMGSEVVIPKKGDGTSGRTINRRFTNIWQKQSGEWKLIARHANEVCNTQ